MNRRLKTLTWGAIPLVALAGLVSIDRIPGTDVDLTVPFAAEGPGPTFNTLGEVDGTPVVEVEGAETHDVQGNLNMTTVSVRTNMTLSQAISRWLFTGDTMVPIEQIFPPGQSVEDVQQSNELAFSSSEASATIAAMNYLGLPVEVEVLGIVEGSAATGHLEEGDRIEAVDGTVVKTPGAIQERIRAKAPGDEVSVDYLRNGQPGSTRIVLGAHPDDKNLALLGVTMTSVGSSGVEVNYNLEDVGGPSAGLMFSLAVVDKLTADQINGGRFVAGTGTIAEDGTVGPIGGIAHKVRAAEDAGAEVFLAPADNCAEAVGSNPDLTVLKVNTLSDAISGMAAYNNGGEYQTCG
ncbi:YlbL family protein [Corynebacterium pacaense]|uniref:YlbL family protein n=1 Tax=Corynebacterium pacaense TaxID=1816684 RepID=UPI0009BB1783|nr:PDZ domain-containing protein [Corynebacterium pacaense]